LIADTALVQVATTDFATDLEIEVVLVDDREIVFATFLSMLTVEVQVTLIVFRSLLRAEIDTELVQVAATLLATLFTLLTELVQAAAILLVIDLDTRVLEVEVT